MKKEVLLGKIVLILFSLVSGMFFVSCQKEEQKEAAMSIEQIREKEGVPVSILELQPQEFEKKLNFFAHLTGIQEYKEFSKVADRIQNINVQVGSQVSAGKTIIEFPTNNPALQFNQAKVALENSEKTYKRLKNLLEAGETSQANFDGAEAQYLVSKRNFESLKQLLFVEAPISGVVTELFIKEGDNVDYGKHLFTIAQINRMKAKIWASDEEVVQLKVGMPAVIKINDNEITGRISEIALAKDMDKKAFGVEVQFDNPSRILKSGMTSDLNITVYKKPNTIIVPRNFIKTELGKNFVFVDINGIASRRDIVIGEEAGINVEVINGLQAGDKLITDGIALVKDGAKIKVTNSEGK
ncbi:MAG TPA: efflux RND transporter periplasmic adaptor subunit [Candidatus Kapabacteria bacterium]|nr:efflux RND transporter periplasmic adaptor subunit [Candidatus Kapabacteria bacterium]HPO63098.1 efflux RND transporter periplasmic adaptor subunit [Candidatus Kapabacteria bacterium]